MTRADDAVDDLIAYLARLSKSSCYPFPYKDCRRLLRTTSQRTKRYDGFKPDLSFYQMNISGLCSWKQDIRKWPLEKMQEAQDYASHSFFEATPLYKPLEPRITKRFTPGLYDSVHKTEQMRHILLQILSMLIEEKETQLLRSTDGTED